MIKSREKKNRGKTNTCNQGESRGDKLCNRTSSLFSNKHPRIYENGYIQNSSVEPPRSEQRVPGLEDPLWHRIYTITISCDSFYNVIQREAPASKWSLVVCGPTDSGPQGLKAEPRRSESGPQPGSRSDFEKKNNKHKKLMTPLAAVIRHLSPW